MPPVDTFFVPVRLISLLYAFGVGPPRMRRVGGISRQEAGQFRYASLRPASLSPTSSRPLALRTCRRHRPNSRFGSPSWAKVRPGRESPVSAYCPGSEGISEVAIPGQVGENKAVPARCADTEPAAHSEGRQVPAHAIRAFRQPRADPLRPQRRNPRAAPLNDSSAAGSSPRRCVRNRRTL